jgi:ankyrin repeat protein
VRSYKKILIALVVSILLLSLSDTIGLISIRKSIGDAVTWLMRDDDGHTGLINAAIDGEVNKVKILLTIGVNANEYDKEGRTALMYAAEQGHTTTVLALLNGGADTNARDNLGRTALSYAKDNERGEVIAILRTLGALE